jgi:peptidoglycan/LPS O-acetylase OafA/YrhL
LTATVADAPSEPIGPEPDVALAPEAGVARSAPSEAYVDGLRALAVLSVMALHAWGVAAHPNVRVFGHGLGFLIARGGWGVELFFVLSGFLLARPWFVAEVRGRSAPSLRYYAGRRVRRIVPAYFVSIGVLLALFVPSGYLDPRSVEGRLGIVNLGAHLTFVHHLLPVTASDFNGLNGVYWTLTMEVLFYLALPMVIRLFLGTRRAMMTTVAALLISSLWVYLSMRSFGRLVHGMVGSVQGPTSGTMAVPATEDYMRALLIVQFPSWLFTFALGIVLARVVVRRRACVLRSPLLSPGVAACILPAAAVGLVLFARTYRNVRPIGGGAPVAPYILDRVIPSLLIAAAIYGWTFGPAWARRSLESRAMRFLGQISYGAYLYHVMIMVGLTYFTSLTDRSQLTQFVLLYAVGLALTMVVASASWYLVERPLLSRRTAGPTTVRAWRRHGAVVLVGTAMAAIALVIGVVNPAGVSAKPPVTGALGTMENVGLVAQFTGPATPDTAAVAGSIYPQEHDLLARCGAAVGATEGLSTANWGATGSVFRCRNATSASAMLQQIPAWEAARLPSPWVVNARTPPGRTARYNAASHRPKLVAGMCEKNESAKTTSNGSSNDTSSG